MKRFLPVALLIAAVVGIAGAGTAHATISCGYDLGTHTVFASANGNNDSLTRRVNSGHSQDNAVNCGSATTANTNTISFTGAAGRQNVTIDLSGGGLGAPDGPAALHRRGGGRLRRGRL